MSRLYSPDRYPWVVTWVRHVHSGPLAGLSFNDSLHFATEITAQDYIEFLNRDGVKKDAAGIEYTASNVELLRNT